MTFAHLYDHPRIPLWWRVVLYAIDHHGQPLERAQLLDAVDPLRLGRSAEVSRAIRQGVTMGMLHPDSSAAMLRFAHLVEQDAA